MTNPANTFECLYRLATHPTTPAPEAHTAAVQAYRLAKRAGINDPRRSRVYRLARQGGWSEAE